MAKKAKANSGYSISPIIRHLLPTRLDFELDCVKQPNLIRRTFIVRNLPQSITSGNCIILKKLMQLKGTTITVRVSNMDAATARKLVDRQFNNAAATASTRRAQVTEVIEAQGDASTLTSFYKDMHLHAGEGSSIKLVHIYIEVYGSTMEAIKQSEERLRSCCSALGITIESFDHYQKDGYWGVSPLGSNTRPMSLANNIPSSTFGRLYPFSASALIDPQGMILGRTADNGLMAIDIWERDTNRTNSNIAIVGSQGQGKSRLIKKIIEQQSRRGTTIYCIDHESEYGEEFERLGGISINCTAGNFAINPLQVRCFEDDIAASAEADEIGPFQPRNNNTSALFQHLNWLGDFFPVLIPALEPRQLATLKLLVQDVYLKFNIDETTNHSRLRPKDYPVLGDVYTHIEDVLQNPGTYGEIYPMIEQDILKSLLLLLQEFCTGAMSPQFNRHTNIQQAQLVNLDIGALMMGSSANVQAVLFNYTTYIWDMIVREKKPFILVVDELHLQLDDRNPTTARYLNSFVRRDRKYNASIITATQMLRDCMSGTLADLAAPLLDIPTYKFLFFPGDTDLPLLAKLQLGEGEMKCISASQRRNCLVKIGKNKYHMLVGSLPYEDELFGKGGGR